MLRRTYTSDIPSMNVLESHDAWETGPLHLSSLGLRVRLGVCTRLECQPPSSPPSSSCHLFKSRDKRAVHLIPTSSLSFEFPPMSNSSERTVVSIERHGSRSILAASPPPGGTFGDQALPHLVDVHPPWVLEEVPRRWGGIVAEPINL